MTGPTTAQALAHLDAVEEWASSINLDDRDDAADRLDHIFDTLWNPHQQWLREHGPQERLKEVDALLTDLRARFLALYGDPFKYWPEPNAWRNQPWLPSARKSFSFENPVEFLGSSFDLVVSLTWDLWQWLLKPFGGRPSNPDPVRALNNDWMYDHGDGRCDRVYERGVGFYPRAMVRDWGGPDDPVWDPDRFRPFATGREAGWTRETLCPPRSFPSS